MYQPHWVCPPSQRVCFPCLHCLGSRLLCWELSEAGPGLHAAQVRALGYSSKAQARLGLHFVPFPGPSSSGDQVLGERSRCDLSPPPSLPLGFLGVQPAHLLRRMSTIQNPKKPWLATKPACSLGNDASLGPRLPSSGSGSPRLPVSGGGWAGPQPASPSQSFVL